jgi:hypothetical protein
MFIALIPSPEIVPLEVTSAMSLRAEKAKEEGSIYKYFAPVERNIGAIFC